MYVLRMLALSTVLLIPSTAYAAAPDASAPPAAPLPSEHRLSDAEVNKVLDAAAKKREASTQPGDELIDQQGDTPAPQIHGEVGVAIGTGGYRSAFGTAVVPLGGDGVAIMSFDTSNFGSHGHWIGPWR
jgi:hypothetical protein